MEYTHRHFSEKIHFLELKHHQGYVNRLSSYISRISYAKSPDIKLTIQKLNIKINFLIITNVYSPEFIWSWYIFLLNYTKGIGKKKMFVLSSSKNVIWRFWGEFAKITLGCTRSPNTSQNTSKIKILPHKRVFY